MRANELQINKLAQGLIPNEVGLKWFASSTDAQKLEIMSSLDLCVSQSHPTSEEIIDLALLLAVGHSEKPDLS